MSTPIINPHQQAFRPDKRRIKMPETQNIEYKESWRDEYLKWICGFANAQGGTIYIGKNDAGEVCGVENSKKLMEDIPNKIRNTLGIVADVNLHYTENGEYIEIVVEPQPYPISYYGEYHYRSGSTKQQLTGQQLNQFLMKKTGLSWDSVPVSNVRAENMRSDAFDIFREQAVRNRRMSRDAVDIGNAELLDSLNLTDENGNIKRAGILLFHHNAEKWVPCSFIKIAHFLGDADIEYQDEIHGPLIAQPDKIMDLLYTKYLKAKISYEGITRVETYPYPKTAVREAILNAIAHKDYAKLTPIQIRVYDDKLIISNDCVFPEDWTVNDLLSPHKSRPYNPLIANAFYRAGYIESWGQGIQKIADSCAEYRCPAPEYRVKKEDFSIVFFPVKSNESNENNEKSNEYNENDVIREIAQRIEALPEEDFSALDKKRLLNITKTIKNKEQFNGTSVALLLAISDQVARKLLRKAEKTGILGSEGTTRDKKFFFILK